MSDAVALGEQYGWVGRDPTDPDLEQRRNQLREHNGMNGLEILNPDQLDDAKRLFYRDGFVVIRDALNLEQLTTIREGCARVVKDIMERDSERHGNHC